MTPPGPDGRTARPPSCPRTPPAEALGAGEAKADVVRRYPASPLAWAALATEAADAGATRSPSTPTRGSATTARLDLLRRNGWKGHGPVPWEHEPNRGFLTCLALLAQAARAIGETDEWERCSAFLRDSSPTAYDALLGS